MPRRKKNAVLIEDTDIYEKVDDFATRVCNVGNAPILTKMPGVLFEATEEILTKIRNVKFVVIYSDQFIISYITMVDDKLIWCTAPVDSLAAKSQNVLLKFRDIISRDNVFDLTGEYDIRGEDIALFAKYVQHTKAYNRSGMEILDPTGLCCAFSVFAKCIYDYAFNNMKDGDILRIKDKENAFGIYLQSSNNSTVLAGNYKIKQ